MHSIWLKINYIYYIICSYTTLIWLENIFSPFPGISMRNKMLWKMDLFPRLEESSRLEI